jgi:hypothetical protein
MPMRKKAVRATRKRRKKDIMMRESGGLKATHVRGTRLRRSLLYSLAIPGWLFWFLKLCDDCDVAKLCDDCDSAGLR